MARCGLPYSLEIGKLAMYVKYLREMREMPPKEVLYTAIPGPFKFEDPTTFQAMTVQRYVGGYVQIVSLIVLNFGFFTFMGHMNLITLGLSKLWYQGKVSIPCPSVQHPTSPIPTEGPLDPHGSSFVKVWYVQLSSVRVCVFNAERVKHKKLPGLGGTQLCG